MTKRASEIQHQYPTKKRNAANQAAHPKLPPAQIDIPTSYIRARSVAEGPMAPVLAAIDLAALKHSGTETEGTLLALDAALEKVEIKLRYEAEAEDLSDVKEEEVVVQGPSCSKIPFVEILFHEAQQVDRRHLKFLLMYIRDLTRIFEGELEMKDREAATGSEGDGSEFDMTGMKIGGLRERSKLPNVWSEPKVNTKDFPGLD